MKCDICRVIKRKSEFVQRSCACRNVYVCAVCLSSWFLTQKEMSCPSCRTTFSNSPSLESIQRRQELNERLIERYESYSNVLIESNQMKQHHIEEIHKINAKLINQIDTERNIYSFVTNACTLIIIVYIAYYYAFP